MSNAPTQTPTSLPTLHPPVSSNEFGFTVGIYAIVFAVVTGVFVLVRARYKDVYSPRVRLMPEETPTPLRDGWFAWFVDLLPSKHDENILHFIGLDAYVTIRFIRFGLLLFALYTPFGMLVLAPIYGSFKDQSGEFHLGFVELITLSNVPQSNTWVSWICLIFLYAYTGLGLFLLHREYVHFVQLRHEHYLGRNSNTRTVLVERIPDTLNSEEKLRRYFDTVVGDVVSVDLVPRDEVIAELGKALEERDKIVTRLERARWEEKRRGGETIQHVVFPKDGGKIMGCIPMDSWLCCRGRCCVKLGNGKLVDSVAYFKKELGNLNETIPVLQKEAIQALKAGGAQTSAFDAASEEEETLWLLDERNHSVPGTFSKSAAFVTFKTNTACTTTSSIPLNEVSFSLIVSQAKEHRDLIWSNLGWDRCYSFTIEVFVLLLNLALLVLFGVLTSTISATTNLDSIREKWTALDEFLASRDWLITLFEQIAPLLLVIAFALVPPILNLILQLQRHVSLSSLDHSFFVNYYVFLVIQVFLFYQISGAIFQILNQVYQNPRDFIILLARTLPVNSTFFMQYIIVRAFWVFPAELLRLSDILVGFLVRPIFCGIPRTKKERKQDPCGCHTIENPGDAWHAKNLAQLALIFSIGIVYSVMSPLICPLLVLFCGIALIVERHQLAYVYIPLYESGGELWISLAQSMVFAFALMQLTFMGYFSLSGDPIQAGLIIPLLVGTIVAGRSLHVLYGGNTLALPLSTAKSLDIKRLSGATTEYGSDKFAETGLNARADAPTSYQHPFLSPAMAIQEPDLEEDGAAMLRQEETDQVTFA